MGWNFFLNMGTGHDFLSISRMGLTDQISVPGALRDCRIQHPFDLLDE
jgi:hypothetical protein